MDQFDFVAVNELYDESVLLLHMQLRIRIVDMLFIPSKNFSNPSVDHSLDFPKHTLALNQRDLEISQYATARLRATIQLLEPVFSVMLQRYRDLKAEAAKSCSRFLSRVPGDGDEKMSSSLQKRRQNCLEDACVRNRFCTAGSFALGLDNQHSELLLL